MGKNGSKNFVNQFKNTRRQAYVEKKKLVKGTNRPLKKLLPGGRKNEINPQRGDK